MLSAYRITSYNVCYTKLLRSAGGGYSLSGGVAQPDAGMMSGGNYQLQGGFWQGTTYLIHLPLVIQ